MSRTWGWIRMLFGIPKREQLDQGEFATKIPSEGKIPSIFIATFEDDVGHRTRLPRSAQAWACRDCGSFVQIHEVFGEDSK